MTPTIETINLYNADGELVEVKFAQLPATARTVKLLAPFLSKRRGTETMGAMIEAIERSLSYSYDEDEIEDILDMIPITDTTGQDGSVLDKITEAIFRGLGGSN